MITNATENSARIAVELYTNDVLLELPVRVALLESTRLSEISELTEEDIIILILKRKKIDGNTQYGRSFGIL